MSTEPLDYMAILADLEAKKAALESTIASFRQAIAAGALGQAGDVSAIAGIIPTLAVPSASGGEVPAGAFLRKSIPEAAKLYLSIVKSKKTTKEIADALKKGGMETTSKNFQNMVYSVLDRARKQNSGIVRLAGSYWGLTEWYPPGISGSGATGGGGKRGKKKKGKASRPAAAEAQLALPPRPITAEAGNAGAQTRIFELLKSKPRDEFSAKQVAEPLGLKIQTVCLVLAKLASKKQIEKTASGAYRYGTVV